VRIVGVNGIHTHGATNTDLVLTAMRDRGFETVDVKLPWRSWFSARFAGAEDGRKVAQASEHGDIIIAHSFGCLRSWHAHKIKKYKAIFCIAPAMSRRAKWQYPNRIECWFSPDDKAVLAGSFLPFHPFGAAGTKGFRQAGIRHYAAPGCSHGGYFYGDRLTVLCDHIERAAQGLA